MPESLKIRIYGGIAMNLTLWIAVGAAIICAGVAITMALKGKNKFEVTEVLEK